ncbi:MAG: zinc metalloprotease HtpX [Candidatus Thermoplasmatota archaeon]|jgi:heat shock protein HtpX|nr:zinc metalloprotease HtpX [Candidatus Thermoplasmatota archaeon]MCL5791115.1 zinc metalloprotease HtpX [Candidatus Thermoplasmatota archaeon]
MSFTAVKLKIAAIFAGIAIALLAALIILGVSYYFFGVLPTSGFFFLIIVMVLVMDIIQYAISPYIISRIYHLKPVSRDDMSMAWLYVSLEKVCNLNNQKVPMLFIADTDMPNAFAFGSIISGRRMAITKGLLKILNKDEIEAVMGHEIGHLKHHDVALLLAIGLIPTILFYFGYTMLFGSGRRNGGSIILVAIGLVAVSFIFNIMILGVNRMRESYADLNSALTIPGATDSLQTALAKIVAYSGGNPRNRGFRRKSTTSSISSMLMFSGDNDVKAYDHIALLESWKRKKVRVKDSIFSDHPHPAKRIQNLEKIKQENQSKGIL